MGPDGVFEDRGRLYTESARPGFRVYGERLVSSKGTEYREWDPRRSKLSAYLTAGGRDVPFGRGSTVLYLGASSGTTPSHVADIVRDGRVVCVEFAPRMFRELVRNSEGRPMMMPVLGDATKPEEYAMFAERVDTVYQDVAPVGNGSREGQVGGRDRPAREDLRAGGGPHTREGLPHRRLQIPGALREGPQDDRRQEGATWAGPPTPWPSTATGS